MDGALRNVFIDAYILPKLPDVIFYTYSQYMSKSAGIVIINFGLYMHNMDI